MRLSKKKVFPFFARKINNSNLCHRWAHVGVIFEDSVEKFPREPPEIFTWHSRYAIWSDKIHWLRSTKRKSSNSKDTFRIAATCRRFLKLLKLLSWIYAFDPYFGILNDRKLVAAFSDPVEFEMADMLTTLMSDRFSMRITDTISIQI